jgi:hypothetical protein
VNFTLLFEVQYLKMAIKSIMTTTASAAPTAKTEHQQQKAAWRYKSEI